MFGTSHAYNSNHKEKYQIQQPKRWMEKSLHAKGRASATGTVLQLQQIQDSHWNQVWKKMLSKCQPS